MQIQNRRKNIGVTIKRAREAAGLTQSQVAKALGYSSPQFISNWERGVATIPPANLKKLSRMMDIDAKEVVGHMVKNYQAELLAEIR